MTIIIPDSIVIPDEAIRLVLVALVCLGAGVLMGWVKGYWDGLEAARKAYK